LTPICTTSFVGFGFAPDPTGGAYSGPPDLLAIFRRPTSKRREGEGRDKVTKFAVCPSKEGNVGAYVQSCGVLLQMSCGQCICLLVTTVCPTKTVEPIEISFGLWAREDPRNRGGTDHLGKGQF